VRAGAAKEVHKAFVAGMAENEAKSSKQ